MNNHTLFKGVPKTPYIKKDKPESQRKLSSLLRNQIPEKITDYNDNDNDDNLDKLLNDINITPEDTLSSRITPEDTLSSRITPEDTPSSRIKYIFDTLKRNSTNIRDIRSKQFIEYFPNYKSTSTFRRMYGLQVGCFNKNNTNQLLQDIKTVSSITNLDERENLTLKDLSDLKDKLKAWNRGCGITVPGLGGRRTKKRRTNKRSKKRYSTKKKRKTQRKYKK